VDEDAEAADDGFHSHGATRQPLLFQSSAVSGVGTARVGVSTRGSIQGGTSTGGAAGAGGGGVSLSKIGALRNAGRTHAGANTMAPRADAPDTELAAPSSSGGGGGGSSLQSDRQIDALLAAAERHKRIAGLLWRWRIRIVLVSATCTVLFTVRSIMFMWRPVSDTNIGGTP